MFTNSAPGFITANWAAPIIDRVVSVSGTQSCTTSDVASELVQIHPLDVGVGLSARRTDHVHLEHPSELRQFRSDGTETDHAHPLATQLGALEAVTHGPAPGFDRRVDFHHPSRKGQHQHEGVFRDR